MYKQAFVELCSLELDLPMACELHYIFATHFPRACATQSRMSRRRKLPCRLQGVTGSTGTKNAFDSRYCCCFREVIVTLQRGMDGVFYSSTTKHVYPHPMLPGTLLIFLNHHERRLSGHRVTEYISLPFFCFVNLVETPSLRISRHVQGEKTGVRIKL